MHNPIVLSTCRALAKASIISFRFNFRGVGRSKGYFADGIGEQEDVKGALKYIFSMEKVSSTGIGLAGYSFGTQVALPVALQDKQIQAVALVSPFLPASVWEQLKGYLKPKLILAGGADQFIPSQEIQRLTAELPEPNQYEIISGADHFWWGYDKEVAEKVSAFFSTALSI
jgi:alpha/beta superfamily hydrolase